MIEWISNWSGRLLNLTLSRGAPRDERERRSRSVIQGTIMALVARGVGSLTGLITVPLTVRYLGAERYGAWITISSVLVFLGFTDFGLASSLTNALGKAFGQDDRESARRYVTTAFFTLATIATAVVVVGIVFARPLANLIFPHVSSALLDREIVPAMIIALAAFALNFPLLVTNRVLAAYQENAIANLWIAAAAVANLVGILIVIAFRGGLPMLVLGSSGVAVLVSLVSSVWLYGWHKPWLRPSRSDADFAFARELFSTSWKFFVANTAWLINSQTDNFIIAHYLGPTSVTPYSVAFRLFGYAALIPILTLPSMWPAYTEAATKNDGAWIRGMFRKNVKFNLLVAAAIVGPLIVFGQPIIRIWAGPEAVPAFSVLIWMAVWNVLLAHVAAAGCLLQATGHINGLTVYGSVTAILNVIISILLVRVYGISGVIAGTVIAYAFASFIPVIVETKMVLRKFA